LSVKEIKRQQAMEEKPTTSMKGPKDRASRVYELKQLKHASQERGGEAMDEDEENKMNANSQDKEAPKIVLGKLYCCRGLRIDLTS
jgi:hypothetical protein